MPTSRQPPRRRTAMAAARAVAMALAAVRTLAMSLTAAATVAVALSTAAAPAFAADDENEPLPELGDSAERVLSPTQEKRIGDQFRRQLFRDPAYIADPEINAYLNRLGAQIAEHASLRGVPIAVHLVQNPQLNAFAVPGGHITFHTGLLLAAENEDELAAVMAHEIAHISQRHLPRMVAKMEASRLPAAAAILASIVVGGQAGLAGLTVANAALLSNQLAYTREFEREADAIGIRLLAESGYDPAAMAGFFGKLEGPSGLGDEGPEFLRTHPLSYTRIAEAENRAADYPPRARPGGREFFFIRAKIRALHTANPRAEVEHFNRVLGGEAGAPPADQRDAAVYGLALVQWKLRQFAAARATLQPLLDAGPAGASAESAAGVTAGTADATAAGGATGGTPDSAAAGSAAGSADMAVEIARAEIDRTAGAPAAAAARYAALAAAGPPPPWLAHYQAEALIDSGNPAAAKRIIRRQLRRHKSMFTLYRPLAKSNAKLGLAAESHQATAEYHAALGEYPAAISALRRALAAAAPEGYLHDSITARLTEIEGVLKQQLQP
ncbi:MAG: M48 family metalloprotease [Gammaproteobacteria bacterium]|nr:M48 family metalloprotease [Gammaproteobacteria bacterium]